MEKIIEAFSKLSTPTVSDALDKLGINGNTAVGIRPLDRNFRLIGRAFTIQYGPIGVERGTVGDYIDDVKPGDIVVLDNAGRQDCTVWGDILTTMASQQQIGGTVIHGVCRDSARSLELGYPIFSCGTFMRTGKDRVQVEHVNGPVSLGGIRVTPGDIVMGDIDGVVVIPKEQENVVLETALQIEGAEEQIREAITTRGVSLREARQQFGYHNLQHK
ncbi:RraA family protein [Alicyclobacillus dauci]|uniref:Putative 4-hydroxy-4-methyl-2-oxoglutarate aldolase n=1 Tax=Alicyclobacillus dauci TaxID=1475485 RepID=A0ABY6Z4Q0_9BACL|nr:RraA family protein [Alicyclobacillus dauci]WAH37633.1 RraA family protein [Alicyclobacillus dauci]